jgi:hypothetical protein
VLGDASFDPVAELEREVGRVRQLDCLRVPAEQPGVEVQRAGAITRMELQVDDGIEATWSHTCFVRPAKPTELIGRTMSFGGCARLPW